MANSAKQLKVFFDTNMLWTSSASDLIPGPIADLILGKNADPLLDVQVYVPQIVVEERVYQMRANADALLPNLIKLERVIGHSLAITSEILKDRIRSTVDARVSHLGLRLVEVDYAGVNWPKLVTAAVNRLPPFDPGEKEKGFRDAIALEAFMQELDRSPKTPSRCIVVFVSGDKVLRDAAKNRTAAASNVRILQTLPDLSDLINTLSSELTEVTVEKLRAKAASMFFTDHLNKNALFYTARVKELTEEQYGLRIHEVPLGASVITQKAHWVDKPVFVKKIGAVIFWTTRLTYVHELKRHSELPPSSLDHLLDDGRPSSLRAYAKPLFNIGGISIPQTAGSSAPLEICGERTLKFDVSWSAQMSGKLTLSKAKIIRIDAIEQTE